MKNKKVLIVFGIIIICFIFVFIVSNKKDNNKKEIEALESIEEIVMNISEKKVISKMKDGVITSYNDKYIVVNNDKTNILLDKNVKEILRSEKEIEVLKDIETNKYYYSIDGKIFDEDSNKMPDDFGIIRESNMKKSDEKTIESDGSNCVGDLSLYGEKYICHDEYASYLLNNNLEKISDYYDDISCNDNGYCVIEKDELKGVIHDLEIIIEPIYNKIDIFEDKILAEGLLEYDLFYLDEGKYIKKTELKENIKDIDIDVDKVISDYKLDDIKDIIENNKEDFKLYAYIVLNNDKLGNYKKYVLDYFEVYIDKIKYVNKVIFFYNLKKLEIKEDSNFSSSALAQYYPSSKLIYVLPEYKDNKVVIHHELMHFIDFEFNSKEVFYTDGNKFISKGEYRKLSKEEKKAFSIDKTLNNYFFIEGSTEYYSSYYFNNGIMNNYDIPIKILHCLINMYGDKIDDVFFGYENIGVILLKDLNMKEYYDLIYYTYMFTYDKKNEEDYKEYMKLLDMIVNLYNKHNANWMDDNKFTYSIYSLIPMKYGDDKLKLSKNYDIYKSIRNKYEEVKNNYVLETNDKDTVIDTKFITYYKGNFYIYVGDFSENYGDNEKLVLKYDHENNKYVKVN